jgi:two-component system, response regulator
MTARAKPITILIAEDDPDDRMLARDALEENRLANDVRFVVNGEDLMQYLRREGKYASPGAAPRPGIILLDLNMPRKDGREALREIKGDPSLKRIPLVVLTTSKAEEDVCRSYELGVAGFITKPVTFDGLVGAMKVLGRYWFEITALPLDAEDEPTPG